jgi:hypothetical protein
MTQTMTHADPVFDAERIARSGIERLAEYLAEPAGEENDRTKLEKARMGHKALTAYASLRSTRQREITGAFAIGRAISAPRSAMAHLFETLTGKEVAHLLPPDGSERSSDADPAGDVRS